MIKFILLLLVFLNSSMVLLAEQQNSAKIFNDRLELYFSQDIRFTSNPGETFFNTLATGYSGGFADITVIKQDYLLYLIGAGLRYYPSNQFVLDFTHMTCPVDTPVGYTIPGSSKLVYKIMSFSSYRLAARYILRCSKNATMEIGGGVLYNIVNTDPTGFGFNMIRTSYFTTDLQCKSQYRLNKRVSVDLGINYDMNNWIRVEQSQNVDEDFSFKISPFSLETVLSFAF
ncbi:MAG: hypothetical protein A2219_05355 [Elusimicrobia bacterium RIFOXYA2_FULL_50_26]|nr:MAG: hypothetical protein A2219_05355 [Elusimicrobia bacterium RIFOXYA2_FULL_50_26]